MISRVSRAKRGLSKYLRDGQRQDSEYSRNQKDQTIPLFGDLDIFEKTENFLNQHKDYSDNYMHITLSFNQEDLQRIEESGKDPLDVYRDMVQDYIKHHTSGYDIDNEVIAYAEVHRPKIKEEHGKERFEHIHIGIALYNPLDDTKLRTDFKHSNFIDDTLQEYVNKKHGLTNPREFSRDRQGINADTNTAKDRKFYINELKDIGSREELLQYFQDNEIKFREVETSKNHYFKIQTPGGQNDINLRGKGFEHLADIAQGKEIKANASRDVQQLGKILIDHYEKRISQIDHRRSAKSKKAINSIYEKKGDADQTDRIYPSYQQKLFSKHYGQMIDHKFTGYWINLDSAEGVTFTNMAKNINVVDRGDKITAAGVGNLKEKAALMLDIAEAKGWKLNTLRIKGTPAFRREISRQIAERIREREELIKNPPVISIARPTSEVEQIVANLHNQQQIEKYDLNQYIDTLPPRTGEIIEPIAVKNLVNQYSQARNEAGKINKESQEFRTAQRCFMDAQILMRDGVNMDNVYSFTELQVREQRLTEIDAQRFAENTVKNARELVRVGILKETKRGIFDFVDDKAKEILFNNIGADYQQLFEINLAEWKQAESIAKDGDLSVDGVVTLSTIKSELSTAAVLQYAADKYKLDKSNYEVTNDNKINNLNNKQKPKNVIDFMQKELNLSGQEAIEICLDLYNQQRQMPELQTAPIAGAKINLNTGVTNATTAQRIVALREPTTERYDRRKSNTADNLPVLSSSKLVSDIEPIELLLQNHDDLDLQRRSQELGNRLRYADPRNDSTQSRSRREQKMNNMPEIEHMRIEMEEEVDGMSDMICNDPDMDDEPSQKNETLQISICKDSNPNALNKWETVDVASYTELAALMKQYPYSAAQFENGYRNSDNAKSAGNVMIYDIDNDQGKPQLTIEEAQKLLEAKGVSAMILPSKSHNADKNGHTAERFRIVIPTADKLADGIDKEEYREFQKLAAKALDLDRFVDTKALNDKARFYYKSPINAVPHIVKANSVMKIDTLQQQAQVNIAARRADAAAERTRIEGIRRDIAKHRTVTSESNSKYLTRADTDKIMSIPIAELIKHLEKAEEYKEGNYHMLRTDHAKYSVVEDNVAHDFKNDITYNNITLLQKHYKTQNLNAIARELEKETGESYVKTNEEAVRHALDQALRDSTNDRSLEDAMKDRFDVKYCKLDTAKETITIADREIKLSDVGQNREQLIRQFRENRDQKPVQKSPQLRMK